MPFVKDDPRINRNGASTKQKLVAKITSADINIFILRIDLLNY